MKEKYTKSDIISWQNLPEDWEKLIGKEVYYSDSAIKVLDFANTDFEEHKNKLLGFDESKLSFHIAHTVTLPWNYIIPVKEPTYEELQAKWIQDNGIKVGSKVRVTIKAEEDEMGNDFHWISSQMNKLISNVYNITDINSNGIEINGLYTLPYFVLESVKEEEFKVDDIVIIEEPSCLKTFGIITAIDTEDESCKKVDVITPTRYKWVNYSFIRLATKDDFVPYDLNKKEVRDMLRGKWVVNKSNDREMCFDHFDHDIYPDDNEAKEWQTFTTAKSLLDYWTFLNGLPCGELKEASND